MPTINRAFKEISCKIVYYGPGLCGKTTNLQIVHKQIPGKFRGELVSLATEQDRTLFFDFLPIDLGEVKGFKTKFQLYTVPGQVFYNATRKLVLRGVDGVVFVADSSADRLEDNIESLQNLLENLQEYSLDLDQVPLVIQYNKRDLPNILSIEELERSLNPNKRYKYVEAVAFQGTGVKETLKAVSSLVLTKLNESAAVRGGGAGGAEQKVSKLVQIAAQRQEAQAAQQAANASAAAAAAAAMPKPPSVQGEQAPPMAPVAAAKGLAGGAAAVASPAADAAPVKPALRAALDGVVRWRGISVGKTQLDFAQRSNVDGKGEFQLTGVVKGWFSKKYWFKLMDKASPGPESMPSRPGLLYFRETPGSKDKHPPVEAWIEENEPRRLYIRQISGSREYTPAGSSLKEILS